MQRVAVGYDASPAARSALDWVTDRALNADSLIEVILVVKGPLDSRSDADEILAEAEQLLRMRVPGIPVEKSIVDGVVARALPDAAADADILVVGVNGGHPIRQALGGWLPQRLGTNARMPTCIVPAGWSPVPGPVVVGLADDGSSRAAVDFAASEAERTVGSLLLVHAWSMPAVDEKVAARTPAPHELRGEHRRHADAEAARVRGAHPMVSVDVEVVEADATAALNAAGDRSAFVVVGSHGRGVLGGGLYGSVALELIGNVTATVCVVPGPADDRPE